MRDGSCGQKPAILFSSLLQLPVHWWWLRARKRSCNTRYGAIFELAITTKPWIILTF